MLKEGNKVRHPSNYFSHAVHIACLGVMVLLATSLQSAEPEPSAASSDVPLDQRIVELGAEARALRDKGDLDGEIAKRMECIRAVKARYGDNHPYTVTEAAYLKSCEKIAELNAESQEVARRARMRLKTGYLLRNENKPVKALEFFRDAYSLCQDILGDDDIITLEALERTAMYELILGHLDDALSLTTKLRSDSERVLGAGHYITAKSLAISGEIELERKNYDRAKELLAKANDILLSLQQEQSYDYATNLVATARLLNRTGKFSEARPCCRQAIATIVLQTPADKAQIFMAQIELARSYHGESKFEECATAFQQIEPVMKQFPNSLPSRAECIEWVGLYRDALKHTRRPAEAKQKEIIIRELQEDKRDLPF